MQEIILFPHLHYNYPDISVSHSDGTSLLVHRIDANRGNITTEVMANLKNKDKHTTKHDQIFVERHVTKERQKTWHIKYVLTQIVKGMNKV